MAEPNTDSPIHYEYRVKCKKCGKERTIPVPPTYKQKHERIREALGLTNYSSGDKPDGHALCPCLLNRYSGSGDSYSNYEDYYDITELLRNPIGQPLSVQTSHSLLQAGSDQTPLSSPLRLDISGYSYPSWITSSSRSLPSVPSAVPHTPVEPRRRIPSCPQLPIPKQDFTYNVFYLDTPLKEICQALKSRPTLDSFALVSPNRNAAQPPYLVISIMGHHDRTKNSDVIDFPRILATPNGWVHLCYYYKKKTISGEKFPDVNALLTHYRTNQTRYGGFLYRQLKRRQVHNRG